MLFSFCCLLAFLALSATAQMPECSYYEDCEKGRWCDFRYGQDGICWPRPKHVRKGRSALDDEDIRNPPKYRCRVTKGTWVCADGGCHCVYP